MPRGLRPARETRRQADQRRGRRREGCAWGARGGEEAADRRGPTDPDGGRGDRADRGETEAGQEPASPGLGDAHGPRGEG